MLRFSTKADSKKSFNQLYRIESVIDYMKWIEKLKINIKEIKKKSAIHEDYEFAENYILDLIEKSNRTCFLGVFDFSKEAYFLNKYPNKNFLVADVSSKAIKVLELEYRNVKVIDSSFDDFISEDDDLIIINLAEIYLTNKQLSSFLKQGKNIVFNNVHLYFSSPSWFVYSILLEFRAFTVNVISMLGYGRQYQFRGWWRTIGDFISATQGSNKLLKSVIFNYKRTSVTKFGIKYSAMIHFQSSCENS